VRIRAERWTNPVIDEALLRLRDFSPQRSSSTRAARSTRSVVIYEQKKNRQPFAQTVLIAVLFFSQDY
jgi:hypothetical protein